MSRKLHIIFILTLLVQLAHGQKINVNRALKFFQAGSLDTAKMYIDSASVHAETGKEAQTWYYRGFIYKEVYNKNEKANKQSPARNIAIAAFFKYLELDTAGRQTESTLTSLRYLTTTIYNDAATALNGNDYESALTNFEQFKTLSKRVDPDKNISDIETQFNLVLAQLYTGLFEQDREKNKDFIDKARTIYTNIIATDSNNLSANYNMGIMYYNDAVNIIKNLDYDLDLITLELIQDDCISLFRKALPYMLKAHELQPKRKETLIGLSGIYFSLNELEKSEAMQKELEKLENGNE